MADIKSITSKMSHDYELISATHHESGHTIFGLLNFIKVQVASVNSDASGNEDLGFIQYQTIEGVFEGSELINYLQLAEININYAGMAAEQIYYKDISGSDKLPLILKSGCSDDIRIAAELIKKFDLAAPGKKRWLFKQRQLKVIRALLTEHWDDVKLIAHALFKHKRLSFLDLKEILIKKSPHKEFWKERFRQIHTLYDETKALDEVSIRSIILSY